MAEEADTWVGKGVWIKKSVPVSDPNNSQTVWLRTLDRRSYHVFAEEGGKIKLRSRGQEGWLPKDKVVLLENAVAYFTQVPRTQPKDGEAYQSRGSAWAKQKKNGTPPSRI